MNALTAKQVGKAMATIRLALRDASAEDRASIAESLRSLLAAVECGAPKSMPVSRSDAPTADRVNAAARSAIANGSHWSDHKAFISDVYALLGLSVSLDAFKGLLVEMQRAGSVSLSRADLVEAMDPAKVRDSEIRSLGASYHFIRVD